MITSLLLASLAACTTPGAEDTGSYPYLDSYIIRWGDTVDVTVGAHDTYSAKKCIDSEEDGTLDRCAYADWDCIWDPSDRSCTMHVVGDVGTVYYIDVYRWG